MRLRKQTVAAAGRINERWSEGQEREKARPVRAIDSRGEIMRTRTGERVPAMARRQRALGTLKGRADRVS